MDQFDFTTKTALIGYSEKEFYIDIHKCKLKAYHIILKFLHGNLELTYAFNQIHPYYQKWAHTYEVPMPGCRTGTQ